MKYWILALVLLLMACRPQPATPTITPTYPLPSATVTRVLVAPTPTPVIYVVQAGESLSGIAAQFEVPMEAIVEANGLQDPNVIKAGQRLIIPGPTPLPTATIPPTLTPTPDVPPRLEIVDVIGRGAPMAETVILVNRGRDVSLHQWTLRDGQGNVFFFPNLTLATGAEVRIHTAKGENTPQHLFWNRGTAVWEQSEDTVILADEQGVVYASKSLD